MSDLIEDLREDGEGQFPCPSCGQTASDTYPYPYCLRCTEAQMLAAIDSEPEECEEAKRERHTHNTRQCLTCAVREAWVREEVVRIRTESRASPLNEEWFGTTGEEFDPDEPEPVPCVLEFGDGRFAFTPGIHALFGSRGSLKTWLGYKAAVQEVKRGNWALIVDYELSYKTTMRRCTLLGATRWDRPQIVYVQPSGPISDNGRARLLARFADHPPSVVVIDSVGMGMAVSGLEENSGTASAQWMIELPAWLKRQWPGAVILPIDHLPKSANGHGSDPIGSQRKGAIADGLWLVKKVSNISRSTRGRGRLVTQKDRDGWVDEGQAVLDFEFGGGGPFVLTPPDPLVDAIQQVGEEKYRIAVYVNENPGVTVEAARTALDIHPNSFTDLKDALAAEGVIDHQRGRGLRPGPEMEAYLNEEE
ncbi:hypothetical protein [Nocardioides sp. HB32]